MIARASRRASVYMGAHFARLDLLEALLARPCTPTPSRSICAILNLSRRALTSRTSALYILPRARSFMDDQTLFVPSSSHKFGPRMGTVRIDRKHGTPLIQTDTPALFTATSRGIVPHLSRDHVHLTGAIRHIQVPFESL